jgi:hypothetical protein
MRLTWQVAVFAGVLSVAVSPAAQDQAQADPRVGLRAGLEAAGEAARHMELVTHLPMAEGFIDPESPGGLGFANTDFALKDDVLFLGSYWGFNFYDIEDPRQTRLRLSVVCPGGQGDLSIHGNLLFMSVQETRARLDCGTEGIEDDVSAERFRGVRIFDVSDLDNPVQVAAIQTCRGSHTHTLVTNPSEPGTLYVYGSGTSGVRPGDELEGCSDLGPDEDPNTAMFSIDVIEVPLDAPEDARIVNRPRIFGDPESGAISALWQGGDHGPGTQSTRLTNQCHDITAYPAIGLAAGACSGNGILLDISDPVNPVRLDHVVDANFAYWHSATFNNDGTKVIFTDEWGGGTRPRCLDSDLPTWGADAVFDIVDGKMTFRGYFKLPASQTETENCVAHNGSIIPVPGRDIMVQAWYQGGVSVFDFTDSANAVEIAFFDRGPVDAEELVTAGYWSTYWYNGYIYGSEIARGLDVFALLPSEFLSQHEIDAATEVRTDVFNAQHQPRVTWTPSTAVAQAYIDQLTRSGSLALDRVAVMRAYLDRIDRLEAGPERRALLNQLIGFVPDLERDAGRASGRAAARLGSLAETIRGLPGALR